MRRSSSGISPVVATVILVAIAIVIAIAVAFWASGLVGIFTRFEKLEILATAYDSKGDVEMLVRNTGSSPLTIDSIYVNGRPGAKYELLQNGDVLNVPGGAQTCDTKTGLCQPGQYIVINVADTGAGEWISGVTYEVAVHTASGKLYPASVQIP